MTPRLLPTTRTPVSSFPVSVGSARTQTTPRVWLGRQDKQMWTDECLSMAPGPKPPNCLTQ